MLHRRVQQHVDIEAGPRLRLGIPARERGWLHDAGAGPARAVPELRRARQSARASTHPAHRQRATRIRAGARQELPSRGQRRDRAVPQRDHQADRGPPASREPLRSGPAARGHEHGRKGGPTRRRHPLRRVRLDADRGLGCQHRHPRARGARLRHPTPVRAGHRPGAAPAILRPERRGRVRRRVRRCARHPVRLHGPPRGRPAAAAARDGPGQGDLAGARCARDPVSARAGVPRRAARGAAVCHLGRELDP